MCEATMRLCVKLLLVRMTTALTLAFATELVHAQAPSPPQVKQATSAQKAQKDSMNAWTLGLAAGQLEGAPIRFATEIARVVDDGHNMIVLPIVTRGPVENLNDLLYLRGVDLAIVN